MELDLENPLTSFKEHQMDTIPTLFSSESDHMPSHNFSDFHVSFRQQAISLLFQAQCSCNFDQNISYLAVNYMDRFLSAQDMPQENPWILSLVVSSCLSLASKMKNAHLSFSDFQGDEGFIFDARTIQRMEFLILNALKWRMRSITPFSFVYFFLSFLLLEDPSLTKALKNRATDIIFKAQHETEILGFKPSVIAASALLSASHELFPLHLSSFRTAISSCEYVNKEKLLSCYSLMQEKLVVVMDENESMLERESSAKTPVSVLDLNRQTDNSECETIDIRTVTTADRGDVKRRKLNDFCAKIYVSAFADSTGR